MIKIISSIKISKTALYAALAVLAVSTVTLATTTFIYHGKYVRAQRGPTGGSELTGGSAITTDQLIDEISRLISLPSGEKPTVATVADPEKLAGQAFFAQAKVGDKVLIYPQAHEAILYRPSEHKLIEVGPFATNVTSTKP